MSLTIPVWYVGTSLCNVYSISPTHIHSDIKELAEATNQSFFNLLKEESAGTENIKFQPLVQSLIYLFLNGKEPSRIAALDWLIMLHKKSPNETFAPDDTTFPTFLKTLSDASDEVSLHS